MEKLVLIFALSLLVSATPGNAATSQDDCEAMFKKADTNADGSLDATESKIYMDAMTKAGMAPTDATKLSNADFMKACEADAFDNLKSSG
jgi:hypothetical protein